MAVILIVDDENDNIRVVEYAFKPLGHTVIGVLNPADTLNAIQQHEPDVIIIDLRLPHNYDGVELGQEIRQGIAPETPMIAVTAAVLSYNRDEVLAAGFDAYVERPYGVKDLRELVGQFL